MGGLSPNSYFFLYMYPKIQSGVGGFMARPIQLFLGLLAFLNLTRPISVLVLTVFPSKVFCCHIHLININPYPAKLIYLNFQPLEVVSRYRDPQPQMVEKYSYLIN